ncbi:MAG TPA: aldehyde dehydrogenase family protein [Actinomycetota bacterium]|nr:aldehyde dehydrogenase family protein [Actinomycetota bacterium]
MQTTVQTLTSLNPATLEPIGEVAVSSPEQVREAVEDARRAQRMWARYTMGDRARLLRRAAAVVAQRADELARLAVAEGGKTLFEAYAAEVMPTAEAFRWTSRYAPRHLRPERLRHSSPLFRLKRSWLHFEPRGVVGIIAPWNYPLSIPATQVAFALAAGNAVVLKPSEFTPLIAEKLREVVEEAGFPSGLLQVVHGHGDVGAALVDARPDKVVFTGSVATGRKVALAGAERSVPVTLELGGKDAAYVRADADLDVAVAGVLFGSYFNAGQTCAAVERVYVHAEVAEVFTERLAAGARSLRVGDPSAPETDVGPMIHAGQRAVVERHVDEAERLGASRLSGGPVETGLPGAFYAPAVLVDVPDDAALMREETFGPVVPVRVVSSDEEAVRLANDSEFGLTASVWTRDTRAARELAHRLEAGTVFVNDVLYSFASPDAPWHGHKSSGTGITHSRYGLHELSKVKHVSIDPGLLRFGYPWTPELVSMMRNAVGALYGTSGRARAAVRAVRAGARARLR